jgi:hypothetical protein
LVEARFTPQEVHQVLEKQGLAGVARTCQLLPTAEEPLRHSAWPLHHADALERLFRQHLASPPKTPAHPPPQMEPVPAPVANTRLQTPSRAPTLTFGQKSDLKRLITDVDLVKQHFHLVFAPDQRLRNVDSAVRTSVELIDTIDVAGFTQAEVRYVLEVSEMHSIAYEAGLPGATPTTPAARSTNAKGYKNAPSACSAWWRSCSSAAHTRSCASSVPSSVAQRTGRNSTVQYAARRFGRRISCACEKIVRVYSLCQYVSFSGSHICAHRWQ